MIASPHSTLFSAFVWLEFTFSYAETGVRIYEMGSSGIPVLSATVLRLDNAQGPTTMVAPKGWGSCECTTLGRAQTPSSWSPFTDVFLKIHNNRRSWIQRTGLCLLGTRPFWFRNNIYFVVIHTLHSAPGDTTGKIMLASDTIGGGRARVFNSYMHWFEC